MLFLFFKVLSVRIGFKGLLILKIGRFDISDCSKKERFNYIFRSLHFK